MIKQTIKYTDFNDVERIEDFFFNLTEAELVDYSVSVEGGIEKKLEEVVNSNDIKEILKIFKELILLSVGKKSDDGRLFVKNDQIRAEFEQCPAYSELYMSFINDDTKAADFVNGILPKSKQMTKDQLDKNMAEAAERLGVPKPETPEITPVEPEVVKNENPVVDMPKPESD